MTSAKPRMLKIQTKLGTRRRIPHWLSWTGLARFNREEICVGEEVVDIVGVDEYGNRQKERCAVPVWEPL